MINYAGMKAEEAKSENMGQLPAGPYVAMVLAVKLDGQAPDESLILQLDVCEGEYKDFFVNKFMAQKKAGSQFGDVKYKGTYRLRVPNPNNTKAQYPETDVRRMNDMIYRFEKSNPGFRWDGNEARLKGLKVGINMQEDSYNGNTFTRIGRLEIADDVRNGLVKAMPPRKRQEPDPLAQPIDTQSGMAIDTSVELPFD